MTRPSGRTAGMVLAAVHGEVDLAAQQRVLDFLHEQPLAADFRERRFLQPIARRGDDDDAAGPPAGGGDARGDRRRLATGASLLPRVPMRVPCIWLFAYRRPVIASDHFGKSNDQ